MEYDQILLKRRLDQIKVRYSLSKEDYLKMLDDQQGLCAVCHQAETVTHHRSGTLKGLAVDHCHVTGAIRGLLCSECNRALGLLHEDPDRIKALLKYVEERVLY